MKTQVETIKIPSECNKLTGLPLIGLKYAIISKENKTFVVKDEFVINVRKSVLIWYFGNYSQGSLDIVSEEPYYFSSDDESESEFERIECITFSDCSRRSIQIPNSVEKLGAECFYQCTRLSRVTLESGSDLREIENEVFLNSGQNWT
jgi:hypothetical protein